MKKAVIIGASSGIGRELSLVLERNGYTVGVTGRRSELLEQLAAISPGRIFPFVSDAKSPDFYEKLLRFIDRMGGMDLFVFCAGSGDFNPDLDYLIESNTNSLNIDAFTAGVGFAYNYFARNGGGHITAVTSIMGLRGSGAAPSYAASKAYQINYLEGLRQKAAQDKAGIKITDLRPGSVDTDMMKGEGHFWISSPERAAEAVWKAIERKKSVAYITPRWQVVGMLLKWLPRGMYKKM